MKVNWNFKRGEGRVRVLEKSPSMGDFLELHNLKSMVTGAKVDMTLRLGCLLV